MAPLQGFYELYSCFTQMNKYEWLSTYTAAAADEDQPAWSPCLETPWVASRPSTAWTEQTLHAPCTISHATTCTNNGLTLDTATLSPPPKQRGYVFTCCLSVCPLDYSESYERILIKFFWGVGRGPRTNPFDFGGNLLYNPNQGSWIGIMIWIQEFLKGLYLLLQFPQTARNKIWKSSVNVWTLGVLRVIIIIIINEEPLGFLQQAILWIGHPSCDLNSSIKHWSCVQSDSKQSYECSASTDRVDEVECQLFCLLKTKRCRMPTKNHSHTLSQKFERVHPERGC